MSLKVVLLTRTSRPSGAQMAWRLCESGYRPEAILIEDRGQMHKKTKGNIFDLISKHGAHFLAKRVREVVKIKMHFYARKVFGKRFKSAQYLSIEELALDYSLNIQKVPSHNSEEAKTLMRSINPDVGILTNTMKIQKEVLDIPKNGFLNLHLSKLPQYAGLDSIFWALFHGEKEIGITVHEAVEKIDEGAIVLQKTIPVCFFDDEQSLYKKALWVGTSTMVQALEHMESGQLKTQVQDHAVASYFSWPSRKERKVLRQARKKPKRIKLSEFDQAQVLHVITRMTRGGAQTNTLSTVTELREKGYRSVLLTGSSWGSEGEILSAALENGVEVGVIDDLEREVQWFKDILVFFKLWNFLRKYPFHIVHTHMSKGGLLGRAAAFLNRTPIVVHTPHGHIFHSYFSRAKEKFFLILERWAAGFTQRLIALTDKDKAEHLDYAVGRSEQWITIPSGVNPELFEDAPSSRKRELREELKISPGAMVIGFLGRLATIKGPQYFLESIPLILEQMPKAHFLFVGDGTLRKELEDRVRSLGINERVRFVGDQRQTHEYLSIMDVLVVPSLNEGMGRVIVEAGFLQKPVIGTEVGGIPDLISHNRTGYLVPPKDAKAIAEAVKEIVADTITAVRLGENLKKKVLSGYTEEHMVSRIAQVYREELELKNLIVDPIRETSKEDAIPEEAEKPMEYTA